MFRILMIKNLISDRITKFLIRLVFWYLIWCFLDNLNLIWWLNRIIFVINKWYSESESTLKKKIVCEFRLSRKFVCSENQTTQTNEFIMFRFCLYSQRVHCCLFRCFFRMIERYESIMFHYHWTLWKQNVLFI